MPVTMKIDTKAFLSAIFSQTTDDYQAGIACYEYVFGMYTVTVRNPSTGQAETIGTGKSTMAIASGKLDEVNKVILFKRLQLTFDHLGSPPPLTKKLSADDTAAAIAALMASGAPTGMSPEQAKAAGVTGIAAPKPMGITSAKLTLPKVELIAATAVGQRVEGTAASSTYYAVALATNFKVAARLSGGKVSVRVEGSPSPDEQQQLSAMGLSKSPSGHWSTHFGIDFVPPERVLGAVLMSIGAKYLQKVESAADVAEALK